jgi:hypothetical protein
MAPRTAESKKQAGSPKAGDPARLDALMGSLMDNAIKEFGSGGVSTCEEFFDSIVGIPMDDNFPLQFLMGIDTIPLHRVVHLVGPPASFKSTLAWYFINKFLEFYGLAAWLDTERKSNPFMVKAFLHGDVNGWSKRVLVHELRSLDETLKAMQRHAAWYDEKVPAKDVPFMLLWDSIGAVTGEKAIEDMNKTGTAAGEGFGAAKRANELTEQFKAFVPTHMQDKPMFLLCTNHLKEKIDANRPSHLPPAASMAGGVGKDFASTCTIKMKSFKDLSTVGETKKELSLQTIKASLAPTGRKVSAIMTLYKNDDGIEEAFFDWNTALCHLLVNSSEFPQTARQSILQLTKHNASKFSSATMGMKDVHPRELGKAIHENKEIIHKLQDLVGIHRTRRFGEG